MTDRKQALESIDIESISNQEVYAVFNLLLEDVIPCKKHNSLKNIFFTTVSL